MANEKMYFSKICIFFYEGLLSTRLGFKVYESMTRDKSTCQIQIMPDKSKHDGRHGDKQRQAGTSRDKQGNGRDMKEQPEQAGTSSDNKGQAGTGNLPRPSLFLPGSPCPCFPLLDPSFSLLVPTLSLLVPLPAMSLDMCSIIGK